MNNLPEGIITFLFTDIQGSSQLWEQDPETAAQALSRHDAIIEEQVADCSGMVVRPRGEGDSRFAVFTGATDAVMAAVAIQRGLAAEAWPMAEPLLVRMALHTGEADLRMGDYYGSEVNRCARIRAIAHGGQTLLSGRTAAFVKQNLPDGVTLLDMGEHYLKDLVQPSQIFQLVIEDLPNEFPPLRSQQNIVHNLPAQLVDIVGRDRELADIEKLLTHTRLITFIGPGGIGKTRLAVEAAGRQSVKYTHGAYFVPLAPLDAAGQIYQAIIEALSLSLAGGTDLKEQLIHYLQKKKMLLLMDNIEHLPNGGGVVNEILKSGPELTILATSREKLNLMGETVFSVRGLRYAGWRTLDEALADSAAQLFVQSAQRAHPGFELTSEDIRPVAGICQMVDGIPLGIMLAAAWVDLLTPQEIEDEIRSSIDFLETEMRDLPPRQRSFRAVFDTSWERLRQSERDLFKKLSVFRGGFTREAAKEVAGASLRDLAGLVNKSFLRRDADSGRYEAHELLRQFAEERLEVEPGAFEAARQAQAIYFADFMEVASERLRGPRQPTAKAEIEADISNIRTAWLYLAERGQAAEFKKFIDSLWYFHELQGWLQGGDTLFSEVEKAIIATIGGDDGESLRAQLLGAKSWFRTLLGFPQEGIEMAQLSLASLRTFNRPEDMCISLMGITVGNVFLNRPEDSLLTAQELHDIGREIGNKWWQTMGMSWLASSSLFARNFDAARDYSEILYRETQRIGDPWLSIWPGQGMAALAEGRGDFVEAKKQFMLVLEAAQKINFKRGMLYTYLNLARVSLRLEEFEAAEGYYLEGLNISSETGQTRESLAGMCQLSFLRAKKGREAEAVELLAVVLQHPDSDQTPLFSRSTIHEEAEELRVKLEAALPGDVYAQAWERGKVADFEVMVTHLLE